MNARAEAYAIALALLVAMAAGSLLILAFGESPARVYAELVAGTWGSAYGIGEVLFRATPLIFTGLAVAVGFRVGLFNIGAEGQMTAGALVTGLVGASLPAATPAPIAVTAAIAAGAMAGGAVGALPGALKARFGAHEVINTIMLNFIVAALALWFGREHAFVAETTHTESIVAAAELPRLGLAGSKANWSLLLALAAAAGVWLFFERTRIGFRWRAVGLNPLAAQAAGARVGITAVAAMALSGALAGAVGANDVLGYKHYYEVGVGRGVGFIGIAVALLGRNHPAGVVIAALFFGTLSQGGVEISDRVPRDLVDILFAVILLTAVATSALARRAEPAR